MPHYDNVSPWENLPEIQTTQDNNYLTTRIENRTKAIILTDTNPLTLGIIITDTRPLFVLISKL